MREVAFAGALLALALVQVTNGPSLALGGADPNLVLAAVAARACQRGPRAALLAAVTGGLFLDLAAEGPLGLHAMAMVAGTAAAGRLAGRFREGRLGPPALGGALASIAYSAVVVAGTAAMRRPLPGHEVILGLVLGGALYLAFLTPAFAFVLRRLDRQAPAERAAW